MSKYSANDFRKSFSFALKGIRIALKSQNNFRIQFVYAVLATILAFILKFSVVEFCILFIVIGVVLICELFNSVVEFILDATYRNRYSKLVEMSKDMSAAGVLIASTLSIIIGSLLFLNKLIPLIMSGYKSWI